MKLGFDEISPITGNKCVMKEFLYEQPDDEAVYAKICFESGYNTVTNYTKDNETLEEIEGRFPDIIRDSKIVDEYGLCWYLSAINLGIVMLYPEPIEGDILPNYNLAFRWVIMPISLNESDMSFVLEEEHVSYFPADRFEDAFDKLQDIAQLHANSIKL